MENGYFACLWLIKMRQCEVSSLLYLIPVRADIWFIVHGGRIPGHKLIFGVSCPYYSKIFYGWHELIKYINRIMEGIPNIPIYATHQKFNDEEYGD